VLWLRSHRRPARRQRRHVVPLRQDGPGVHGARL